MCSTSSVIFTTVETSLTAQSKIAPFLPWRSYSLTFAFAVYLDCKWSSYRATTVRSACTGGKFTQQYLSTIRPLVHGVGVCMQACLYINEIGNQTFNPFTPCHNPPSMEGTYSIYRHSGRWNEYTSATLMQYNLYLFIIDSIEILYKKK